MLPDPIQRAAAAFDSLPGVGPRAALRYATWLLSQPKEVIERFGDSLRRLSESVHACDLCGQWSDQPRCSICRDTKRDATLLCIVATSPDVRAVEETGVFKGTYHVLGGTLDPIEGRTPDTLRIAQLMERLRAPGSGIREIILALDADAAGDVTALYLSKQLESWDGKVSRLARGLSTGASLEYVDANTLADALENRKQN